MNLGTAGKRPSAHPIAVESDTEEDHYVPTKSQKTSSQGNRTEAPARATNSENDAKKRNQKLNERKRATEKKFFR
jgi:hypothetical protein